MLDGLSAGIGPWWHPSGLVETSSSTSKASWWLDVQEMILPQGWSMNKNGFFSGLTPTAYLASFLDVEKDTRLSLVGMRGMKGGRWWVFRLSRLVDLQDHFTELMKDYLLWIGAGSAGVCSPLGWSSDCWCLFTYSQSNFSSHFIRKCLFWNSLLTTCKMPGDNISRCWQLQWQWWTVGVSDIII